MLKLFLAFVIFLTGTAGLGQSSGINGIAKSCNKDANEPYVSAFSFGVTQKTQKDTIEFIYSITWFYTFQSKTDTSHITRIIKFSARDSSLTMIRITIRDTTKQSFVLMGIAKDSLVALPSLSYSYDNPDDPDNQMFYLFNPSYGIIKESCPVWWWYRYYYRSDKNIIKEFECH